MGYMEIRNYISVVCALLEIEDFDVVFKRSERCFDLDRQTVDSFSFRQGEASTALPELNVVRVNLDIVQGEMIYIALAHEARHLFQFQAISNPVLRENTNGDVDLWEKEFEDCRNGIYSRSYSCEKDARIFAEIIAEILFGYKVDETEDYKRIKNEIDKKYVVGSFPKMNLW